MVTPPPEDQPSGEPVPDDPSRPVSPIAERLNRLLATGATLDRLMAAVAEIAPPRAPSGEAVGNGPDVREQQVVSAIDGLAEGVAGRTVTDVVRHVFDLHGFAGDIARYYDPANSLIPRVLERRRGIPISLAAVVAEVGRRNGVSLRLVGMPGHVLLTDASTAGLGTVADLIAEGRWYDPFDRGAVLDYDGCRRLFSRFHPIEAFEPNMLAPMQDRGFVIRNLNNLRVAYTRLGDLASMVPVLAANADLIGAGPGERLDLANALELLGRSESAAAQFDRLAESVPERADAFRAKAALQRARRN